MVEAASDDALEMIEAAMDSLKKAGALDTATQQSLTSLLTQATVAWSKGKAEEESAEHTAFDCDGKAQMALWGGAYTDYATAQLYAQMVTAQLIQH